MRMILVAPHYSPWYARPGCQGAKVRVAQATTRLLPRRAEVTAGQPSPGHRPCDYYYSNGSGLLPQGPSNVTNVSSEAQVESMTRANSEVDKY